MDKLIRKIKNCQECKPYLVDGTNPVLRVSAQSKIVIIGQAPGRIVHESGVPWEDKSGDRLREWLGVTNEIFCDPYHFGIVPMGFCFPGSGKSGDLAPRKECAPLWHQSIFDKMQEVKLTLLIGSYAQKYYLGKSVKKNLTETVSSYEEYLPEFLPLPHPSPRNNIWLKKNPWFEKEVLRFLQKKIQETLR